MRVALVGPYPLEEDKPQGGVHVVMKNLVDSLASQVDFHIITVDHDGVDGSGGRNGVVIHALRASKKLGQLTLYARERRWIRSTISAVKPDVVHVHGTDLYGAGATGVWPSTVVTVHGILMREADIRDPNLSYAARVSYGIRWWFNARFERQTLKQARHIIVISPYVESLVRPYTSARFYHIDNPVDPSYFRLRDMAVSGRVLFVGMIRARKGLMHLVRAIHLARETWPEIHLHIVGKVFEPDYARAIDSYVRENGLEEHVIFRGRLPEHELHREFEQCSVLCLPSIEESSPMVIEQAMAAGKPVVASRVGGIPYLVEHGKSGFLVDYGDEPAFAKALLEVCRDPELRARMGAVGREIARRRFDPQKVAESTLAVYREVAGRGGK